MQIRLILCCWFCIGSIWQAFGQEDNLGFSYQNRQFVFWNVSNYFDPNGVSLQLGYNRQSEPWMDLQMELGFVSDNLLDINLPFEEYAGFRIRPQIKFLNRNTLHKERRLYGALLLSYQRLNFKENNNFRVEDSFNQNITYGGRDQTFAWYLVGGVDKRTTTRFVFGASFGIGQVHVRSKVTEGDVPDNARLLSDCRLFCGRANFLNFENTRLGVIFDLKLGYQF